MAKRIVDNLGDFIALLLDTSVIGEQGEAQKNTFLPIYVSERQTWDHGPVTCTPLSTWTSSDTLDGKVS